MNTKLVAYRFRIYPNTKQKVLLCKTFGCVRWFWNNLVSTFNSYNKETNPKPTFKTSTEVRNENDWMLKVSAAALQQKEMDFKEFKNQLFNKKRKSKVGFPKYKKKSDNKNSYRLPNQKFKIINNNKIQIEKIGKIKLVMDRCLPLGKLISVTISRNPSNQYFVSIIIEKEIKLFKKTNEEIGIDVGLTTFATLSNGTEINNPKYFNKNQIKIKKLQKVLSRRVNNSKRKNKIRIRIAKLHQKVINQRDNFLHNLSTELIRNYDRIYIEDLNISGMMKNHRLANSISDASWGKFINQLTYKADWYGKEIIKVNRYYPSSKTCECGVINSNLKLSDRIWTCNSCGLINQRDHLASNNILKEGRRSLGVHNMNAEIYNNKSMKRLEQGCR